MSYVMEFEDASKVDAKDTEIKYDGFRVVVDPKSLMFVYGMTLNYRFAAPRSMEFQKLNCCCVGEFRMAMLYCPKA